MCSKSEITVRASLTAAKDSDLRICERGQKTLAPNWTSAVEQVAEPVSSFGYRSFHEGNGWRFFVLASPRKLTIATTKCFRAKQVSDTEAWGFYHCVRYDMLNVRPALPSQAGNSSSLSALR